MNEQSKGVEPYVDGDGNIIIPPRPGFVRSCRCINACSTHKPGVSVEWFITDTKEGGTHSDLPKGKPFFRQ